MAKAIPNLINVVLTVDAQNLWSLQTASNTPQLTLKKIGKYCKMSDDNDGSNEGTRSVENFTTYTYPTAGVRWTAAVDKDSAKSLYTIDLMSVYVQTIFGTKAQNANNGAVEIPAPDDGLNEQFTGETEYFITFNITFGGETRNYTLDPKIRMNPIRK